MTEIIKITFARLNKDGVQATPDMYRKYFCEEAKKLGVYSAECSSINSLIDTLSYRNRQIIKKLKISSMDELLSFLIAQLEGAKQLEEEQNQDESNKTQSEHKDDIVEVAKILKNAMAPLTKITHDIANTVKVNRQSGQNMATIRNKLNNFDNINFSNKNHTELIKTHFIGLANNMEEEATHLSETLLKDIKEISNISSQITSIQREMELKYNDTEFDALTELYTKAGIQPILEAVEGMFKTEDKAYSMILFDIDRLNKLNKLRGRSAGDSVLKDFSKMLSDKFSKNGAVARLENNKFLIMLFEQDINKTVKLANEMSNTTSTTIFHYENTKTRITLSGAVCIRTHYESQDKMLKQLEVILQSAKKHGGNLVEIGS